ncbi:biotin--[acetyl-CoA-carboxylase] ligase [Candidatus Uhrbacteria bacterium]|nr:biotin--[acetyl-CoA-carboxylase] ligase [Candidatus Uhrbacteria bacterium]
MERRDPELEEQLLQTLNGVRFGRPCYAFRQVGSTMDVAKQLATQGEPEGTLVFAARQEQGRGRLGRRWESPEGGAYFSLILKPSRPPAESPQLSLVAGLAAAEAIQEQHTAMAAASGSRSGTRQR